MRCDRSWPSDLSLCRDLRRGKSDYSFLIPLVNRLLYELSIAVPQQTEVADSVGIDAPRPAPNTRAERIEAAIQAYAGQCSLFIIHADADGDRRSALAERVEPGRQAAGAKVNAPIVACIPFREIEAWLLADGHAFAVLLMGADPALPRNAEADPDPKRTLSNIHDALGLRGAVGEYYGFLGENVSLEALRRLSAFRDFEDELRAAVDSLGRRAPG
jgi:hypothetical protein